ncbi:transcriptional activator hac1 [Naviculisporaceae sp. PSN 640]
MESWSAHTPASLKFENSPTESLLSSPDEMYPSLFGTDVTTATMNPIEIMTPRSTFTDGEQPDVLSLANMTPKTEAPQTPAANDTEAKPEQKQVKKRKSWGQVLPEPKTNLPPRKRARTADEKEQRRVERVLRNRRAAQSSRERKRQEVEGLERRNQELEALLRRSQEQLQMVCNELQRVKGGSAIVGLGSGLETLGQAPMTLSQPLFGAQPQTSTQQPADSIDEFLKTIPSNQHATVNPASLSPTLSPVPEENAEVETAAGVTSLAAATVTKTVGASDATQHPAAMLCQGLQCPTTFQVAPSAAPVTPRPSSSAGPSGLNFGNGFDLPTTFDADRYVLESGLLASPNSSDLEYDHLVGDDTPAFPFATSGFDFDISDFLADEQQAQHQSLNCAAAEQSFLDLETQVSSEDSYQQPQPGASLDGCDVGGVSMSDDVLAAASTGGEVKRQQKRPSKEVLLTLAWALKVEQRRIEIRKQLSGSGKSSVTQTTTSTLLSNNKGYVLKVVSKKRSLEQNQPGYPSSKRTCFE